MSKKTRKASGARGKAKRYPCQPVIGKIIDTDVITMGVCSVLRLKLLWWAGKGDDFDEEWIDLPVCHYNFATEQQARKNLMAILDAACLEDIDDSDELLGKELTFFPGDGSDIAIRPITPTERGRFTIAMLYEADWKRYMDHRKVEHCKISERWLPSDPTAEQLSV